MPRVSWSNLLSTMFVSMLELNPTTARIGQPAILSLCPPDPASAPFQPVSLDTTRMCDGGQTAVIMCSFCARSQTNLESCVITFSYRFLHFIDVTITDQQWCGIQQLWAVFPSLFLSFCPSFSVYFSLSFSTVSFCFSPNLFIYLILVLSFVSFLFS